ncbi:MAG: sensor histidine kinase [Bradyrhizobium sp.]
MLPLRLKPSFLLRPPSLAVQLLLTLLLITAVVSAAAGLIVRDFERGYLTSRLTMENERKFDLLVYATTDDIISQDVPRIDTTMHNLIQSDSTLLSLEILNPTGRSLFTWHRDQRKSGNGKTETFPRQVRLGGEFFGTFSTVWDLSAADRKINQHGFMFAAVIGTICLTMSLLFYVLIRRLAILPLKLMGARLAEFRHGVFNRVASLPPFTPLELRDLEKSINQFGELLAKKEQYDIEREAAHAAAVAANRTKSEFLANISHDLRTPLNAIIGFSETMRMGVFGPVENPKYREYVEYINGSGEHLLSIINDILDISKIQSGKMSLEEGTVDLRQTIETSLVLVSARALEGGVRIVKKLPARLPFIHADERKLKQILLNLITNSVKYTPFGGSVTISVSVNRDLGILVTVADTGIGIAADQIRTALEPFAQIENAYTRRETGTGLGLPIAKALIELHGGTFELTSEVGVGTMVRFSLPVARLLEPSSTAEIVELGSFRANAG